LGLSAKDRGDLVAYLNAVGDADKPVTRNTVQAELEELTSFSSVLDIAIPQRNSEIVALATDALGNEGRELGEKLPGRTNPTGSGGLKERMRAQGAIRGVVLTLRRIAMAAADGDFGRVAEAYAAYQKETAAAADILKQAEPYSLFNPKI